ncbi:hypothetical protein LPJ55_001714 [Coemansia sp. RSA 990]|nr:hypothetical protein LPJ55_001714 [Coemansia sp. RSA 990]
MQFELLPEDILNLVLDNLFPNFMQLSGWKPLLHILAICQRLRHLYYPRIYDHVFIDADFSSESANVLSNIDLIASSVYPRNLKIVLQVMPGGYELLQNAVSIIEQNSTALSKVDDLGILLMGRLFEPTNAQEIDGIEAKVTEEVEKMAQILAAVKKLDISGNGNDEIFPGLLTKHFAAQLQKFSCVSYDVLSVPTHFKQVTQLHIRLFDYNDGLLRICPETIQELTIYNLPPECTWNLFTTSEAGNVVVPHLRKLRLGYADASEEAEFNEAMFSQCKLHFPQLERLQLWGSPEYFPLLNMAVLPENMDKIVLSAYPDAYTTFKDIVLPPARTLQCDIREGPYTYKFSLRFNGLIQNSQSNEVLSIRMSTWFEDLHCPNMTNLHIDEPVDTQDMVSIIKRHSRLQSLSLNLLADSVDCSKDLEAALNGKAPVKPLNTSLKELYYNGYDPISPESQEAIQHLVLQLPALTCLGGFDIDAKQFMNGYLPQYPHLANIEFQ